MSKPKPYFGRPVVLASPSVAAVVIPKRTLMPRGRALRAASHRRECVEDGEIVGGAEWLRWPSSRQRGRSGGERLGLELVELSLRDRAAVE